MDDHSGFVVSSTRTLERNASSEIYYVMTELLDYTNVSAAPVKGISGLSIATFKEDSVEALKQLQDLVQSEPIFQYVLKIVPFQFRVESQLEKFQELAQLFNNRIEDEDTWRINVRRRHTQIPREEIISSIANEITRGKVMLESPKHYIIVEIIGKWSYLSLSPIPELAISVSQLKEDEEDEFTF